MKLQNMAILFIIIILPISLVLEYYTKSRTQTISLQTQYDAKLMNATYDAIKAYQINSFNNTEDGLTESKLRDIKASVNTFYNSIATNFSSLGYTKSALQNYIPALVYTMYDGYYIYGPFTNTWDDEAAEGQTTYKRDEITYGLKPYVFYSCRYMKDSDNDVVITYSLDNYIEIQGKVNGNAVSKYGYLVGGNIDTINWTYTPSGSSIAIPIRSGESFSENIFVDGELINNVRYVKINGTKYYYHPNIKLGRVFYILNGKSTLQTNMEYINNKFYYYNAKYQNELGQGVANNDEVEQAKRYYKNAYEMKEFIDTNLRWIDYDSIQEDDKSDFTNVGEIFDDLDNIEKEDSAFNTHRMDVIKHAINKNLSVAISNYNHYYNTSTDFQMPKLKETDWEKLISNIGMISFMQGVSIGGKIYNGYSIVNNNKNSDVVMEDSIYIQIGNEVHKVTEEGLASNINSSSTAIFNIDVERRSGEATITNADGTTTSKTEYYFPHNVMLAYNSLVTQDSVAKQNLAANLNNPTFASLYYTALGRERYSLYRQKVEF